MSKFSNNYEVICFWQVVQRRKIVTGSTQGIMYEKILKYSFIRPKCKIYLKKQDDYYFSDLLALVNISSIPEDCNNSTYFFARYIEIFYCKLIVK